jgi:cyclopropane-fatty-acyl-phospholipid synthase
MAHFLPTQHSDQPTATHSWPILGRSAETSPERDSRGPSPLAARLVEKRLANLEGGSLKMRRPDGSQLEAGDSNGKSAADLTVHRWRFFRRLVRDGDIGAGESYMDGDWSSEDLVGLAELFLRNEDRLSPPAFSGTLNRWRDRLVHRYRDNRKRQARRNIRAHYDLSNRLFATFLDDSMTYSAGIFESTETRLLDAQRAKYLRMADAAGLVPGHHVLEIGCGWGGFAEFAASKLGCRVTGITLSDEQARFARQRICRAGLDHAVDIRVVDYRELNGIFDAVVSIEMLEAVGHRHLDDFFAVCDRHLVAGGRAAIQTITVPDQIYDRYRRGTDWIRKYIFAGGHLPSLGAIQSSISRTTGFVISRAEDIGPHYATTLNRWRRRFHSRLHMVRELGFDERFIRMWDFYLATCEAAFACGKIGNLQLALKRAGESGS